MGGYNPNPAPDEPTPPKTAADAAAIAGAQVGFRGSYGGPTGANAQRYNQLVATANETTKTAVAAGVPLTTAITPAQVASGVTAQKLIAETPTSSPSDVDYALLAQQNAVGMTGYTPLNTLGDAATQRMLAAADEANRVLGIAGLPTVDRNALIGQILSGQLDAAKLTPDTRDDQFFNNELQKWVQNKVLLSQSYHNIGQDAGVPIPANPFEYAGDLALALQKGGNPKDFTKESFGFNPGVGDMITILPGNKGLQETAWDVAKTGSAATGSFTPAVTALNAASGLYGVYGNLAGGKQDTRSAFESVQQQPATATTLPAPFISKYTETRPPTGEIDVFGTKVVVPGLAFFQPSTTYTREVGTLQEVKTPFAPALAVLAAMGMPTIGRVPVGDPYIKDGVTMQDYKTYDLSTAYVRPITETTVAGKSGYDVWQGGLSDKAYSAFGGVVGDTGDKVQKSFGNQVTAFTAMANRNPEWVPLVGASKLVTYGFDKPVEAPVNFVLMFAGGAAFRGGEAAYSTGRAAIAANVISEGGNWRRFIQTTDFVVSAAPKALAFLYGVDVVGRSTEWGRSTGAGDVTARMTPIVAYETMPMLAGGYTGYYSPEIAAFTYRSAIRTPSVMSDAAWAARQRLAGITQVEPGSLNYQYRVTGTPVYDVTPPKTPSFDNAAGVKSWGGVRQKMAPDIQTLDLRDTIEFPAYGRPESVATPAEQAMVMRQYDLTPQEIRLAKLQGLSLNDILSLRQTPEFAPPVAVALVQPVAAVQQVHVLQQMQMPKALTLEVQTPTIRTIDLTGLSVERAPAVMLSPLLGTQAILGTNLIQKLSVMQAERNKQEVVLGRIPVVDVTPVEKTKTGTVVIPSFFTDTIPIQNTDIEQRIIPVITPEVRPWTVTTPEIVIPPVIIPPILIPPVPPLFGGSGGGGSGFGAFPRKRRQVETFYIGPQNYGKSAGAMKMPTIKMPRSKR